MKNIKNTGRKKINKPLLILLISAAQISAQTDDSIETLEEMLINMGSSLELNGIVEGEDLREIEIQNMQQEDIYLYEQYIDSTLEWNNTQIDQSIELPSVYEVVDLAQRYHQEGVDALTEVPLFNPIGSPLDPIAYQCNTNIPATFYSLSQYLDPENELNLNEQLTAVFSEPIYKENTMENLFGEEWQIEVDFDELEDEFLDQEINHYFLSGWVEDTVLVYEQQNDTENEPYEEAPVMYSHLPNPMIIKQAKAIDRFNTGGNYLNKACEKLAQSGTDPDTWMKYEKHNEFTIHYRLCGNNGVSSDLYERVINKAYLMPNWSLVELQRCTKFTKTCAPMHVQMIAADILYERKIFSQAGYKLPGHWNVEILSNNPNNGASAFLGTIKLNGVAQSSRGLRNLVFHEYFHAIETQYGSEWEWLWNGEFTGRFPSFQKNTAWWSQLESLADWAPHAIGFGVNPWPSYYNSNQGGYNQINDARNHLLESSYHPLEYGYLAERYSKKGNTTLSSCQGCDSIKQYLEILNGEPYGARLWNYSYIALYTFVEMMKTGIRPTTGYEVGSIFSFNRFSQDYHLDLLFSRLNRKWATASGNFRFLNRFAPKSSTLWPTLTQWPPAIQTIPQSMATLFGQCTQKNKPMKRTHASQVGQQYIHGFTCDMKMSPSGAIYLDIPLDNNNLPDKIMLTGVGVKLHNDDINAYEPPTKGSNYRIKAGELINGNLRIFTVPAELSPQNTMDFNSSKALSLYGNTAAQNSYTVSLKNLFPTSNHLYLVIDYPFLSPEWMKAPNGNHPQRDNFMARIGVVGYWDN